MYYNSSASYDLAQARIAGLRDEARRENLARAVARSSRPVRPRVPGRLLRHRAAPAVS